MSGYVIHFDGAKDLEAKLKAKSELDFTACLKRTTTILRNNARKNTPVAASATYTDAEGNVIGEHRGGKLVQSLRMTMPSDFQGGTVGYTLEYAPHVEYGHRQRVGRFVPVLGKRLKASFVKGQYFLKKAVEDTRPEFINELKEALKK